MCSFLYTSHELWIGFQCKGSCKGPYTLTAVSDYNAWYNETLNSFFLSTQQWSKQNGEWNHFVGGTQAFSRLLPVVMATALFFFFFLHNNVFMALVPAGGLLANMGGQDSLRPFLWYIMHQSIPPAPSSPPGNSGGALGAGGIDWCIKRVSMGLSVWHQTSRGVRSP